MKTKTMEKLAVAVPKELEGVSQVITVDGLGIVLKAGWILVRPSGTEPVIRVTCEAPTEAIAQELLTKVKTVVERTIAAL